MPTESTGDDDHRLATVPVMERDTSLDLGGRGSGIADAAEVGVDRVDRADHHDEAAFLQLVVNALLSNLAGTFLWFALTFWVYLETRSVVATGVIGGSFGLASAVLGPWFGTYVDHHRKHAAMTLATTVSTASSPWPRSSTPSSTPGHCSGSTGLGSGCSPRSRWPDQWPGWVAAWPCRRASRCWCRPSDVTRPTAWSARSLASASPSPRCSAAWRWAWPEWGGR